MSNYPKVLWSATTRNRKTGNIPTAWVGESRDESIKSCKGCPLLAKKVCYSQNGIVAMGANSMIKSRNKKSKKDQEEKYSFEYALKNRAFKAKAVRMSAIGDAARCNQEEVAKYEKQARKEGLAWLSYTHFANEIEDKYKYLYVASSGKGENLKEDLKEARDLLKKGWNRVTAVVPWDTYETPKVKGAAICPAMLAHSKGSRVNCNECRLCDPKAKGPKIIMFPLHGKRDKRLFAAAKAGKSFAINLLKKL